MPDSISLTGVVATDPRHITTNEGLEITSFRLASSQRRFDKGSNTWVETGTNWYTVTAFRQLAANLATSVNKGDRVIASGRLRLREWASGEKNGTTIEIDAETVGHDLAWGCSTFSKSSNGHGSPGGGAPGGAAGGAENAWAQPPSGELAAGGSAGALTDASGWGVPGASSESSDGFVPSDREAEPVGANSGAYS